YSWNTGATSSSLNVSPTTTTVYTVTGTTNNCSSTKTTTVNVTQTPTISVSSDVTITKGSSTTLSVSGNTNSISWTPNTNLSCNTCANPIASPSITTQYCVKSKNGACESNECILVIVESDCKSNADYSTPNAFTPNGDGLNDAFCLQGWDECSTTFYIAIFDRWGEKVFDSSDPSFCWDGNYLGVPLNPAVFVFYIKAEILNVGSITKKGNITLIK
ncbi:MAG: gliding motility-associated C-terminal domain-containing protein, partial [Bacteroidia bacterium]|nr:gliding motility-associated C-terminal domain-containing protein [Bacteroidia bacterium]